VGLCFLADVNKGINLQALPSFAQLSFFLQNLPSGVFFIQGAAAALGIEL
jgi:hypothetical protein